MTAYRPRAPRRRRRRHLAFQRSIPMHRLLMAIVEFQRDNWGTPASVTAIDSIADLYE
jgi:hypothetical protein